MPRVTRLARAFANPRTARVAPAGAAPREPAGPVLRGSRRPGSMRRREHESRASDERRGSAARPSSPEGAAHDLGRAETPEETADDPAELRSIQPPVCHAAMAKPSPAPAPAAAIAATSSAPACCPASAREQHAGRCAETDRDADPVPRSHVRTVTARASCPLFAQTRPGGCIDPTNARCSCSSRPSRSGPGSPHGEPARAHRAQGARPASREQGRRRRPARARRALPRRARCRRSRSWSTSASSPGSTAARRRRGSRRCSSRTSATSRSPSRRALEPRDHREPEVGGALAVDDAVVERDGDVPHPADDDLAVADDRPLLDAVDAEDRDLRVVDERRHEQAGGLARARDRERAAAQLLRFQRPGVRGLGEAPHLGVELVERELVGAVDDRARRAPARSGRRSPMS